MRRVLRRATALTLDRPDLHRPDLDRPDLDRPDLHRGETVCRVRLMAEVPAVRARLTESMSATGRLM
ncbi:hypothetical protein NGM37_13055, partial [Streptomyces sp. TRM76130]|nr:hypothetical protein [Streptomyces sp. TRM76130]